MRQHIYPCLWFDGRAKEAAAFYCSIFRHSKITMDTPTVVHFELCGKKFMALNGGPMFSFTPAISFYVTCETVAETNEVWAKISEGGQALMPIGEYTWSERYGWARDRYGLTWQISVTNEPGSPQNILPSMLFTKEQFGRAEEALHFYTRVFEQSSIGLVFHYPHDDPNAGKVMYSEFKLNQYDLIAMDGPGVHEYTFNEAVSIVVECESQEIIDHYWGSLTAEGKESMCGWLKDKYGVSWQILPSALGKLMSDREKGARVMQALLKMKKPDLSVLQNA